MSRPLLRLGIALALLLAASPAFACPVCGGGGQNRQAFIDTMVFLSAMPLLMIGAFVGVVWVLARRAAEEDADAQREPQRP